MITLAMLTAVPPTPYTTFTYIIYFAFIQNPIVVSGIPTPLYSTQYLKVGFSLVLYIELPLIGNGRRIRNALIKHFCYIEMGGL